MSGKVVARAVAPGLMAFGLFVWADAWTYSPLALNAFKCALGSSLFGVVVLFYRRPMPGRAVLWLAFSSLLGIVIADTLWLAALQILGARRMIAIDALKPFVAAFMGYFLLGDAVPWLGYLGVVVCALGVYLLNVESAEKETEDDTVAADDVAVEEATEPPYLRGSPARPSNVILDVYAATITVAERGPLSSVNYCVSASRRCSDPGLGSTRDRRKSDAKPMVRRDWMRVALGVVFVTFLTP